jgi:hypothetical protein
MGKDAVILGGNWNNGANAGSRCSNWNNAASNSNNNIGVRFSCEHISKLLYERYGFICRPSKMWSAIFSFFLPGEELLELAPHKRDLVG